ncbi:hypothetical protein [Aequorivita viscosa]|uniref:Uncharacterized protein n=1 Tax=Aequorivita viscosa TaxID=797419 RepID=A0A1M6CVI9_9FLAO|nr:hypothetical protein [Aequorivita viscosa]SDW41003.1 hypothetical protein SAMN05216556_10580 [Aequorivita viscosa]SHI64748.1 hypothetical protein SAMN04487908_10480 [Aequorivita viscosa]
MKQFRIIIFTFLIGFSALSQNIDFSSYSYVIVPDKFEFLNAPDQFQLNSMSLFYLKKSGFNAFLAKDTPNANRCDGLYANVEELKTLFGTKLQVVLLDCDGNEVYRSDEGKSKYKEFEKTYQDALRKAFESVEKLGVSQSEMVQTYAANSSDSTNTLPAESKLSEINGVPFPSSKFSNYVNEGKSYLLRKTAEGYSLYKEDSSSEDGLKLVGKIVVMEKVVKYIDVSGNVADADFDQSGNLIIKTRESTITYDFVD